MNMNQNEIKKPKLRAAVYLRCSTDEQAKEGYGIAYQEDKIKSFVASQDYLFDNKNHTFKDEGFSGTLPIEERPELKRLFEAAEKREFDVVLVYRLDRFFRKIILLLSAVEKLTEYNIGFKSTTEPFDTSSHFGRYLLASLGALAELERDVIKERMTGGRIMAAKAGKWVLGQTPYGYKIDKRTGKLKIIPEEAQWIRKFFEWLIKEQMSLNAIARRINELKIPSPRAGSKINGRQVSGYWMARVINRILTNETYGGIFYFRKYDNKRQLRSEEEWVPIQVPAIVAPQMIESAKAQLQKNREFASRKSKLTYLFAKLIYCGKCGFKLFGAFSPPSKRRSAGSRYYRGIRTKYLARQYQFNTKRCDGCGEIAESRLEPIWEAIENLLNNPKFAFNKLQRYTDRSVNRKETKNKLSEIDRELVGIEERRKRADVLYSETRRIDYAEYRKRLNECDREEGESLKDKVRLVKLLENRNYKQDRIKALKVWQEKLSTLSKVQSYENKYKIIHYLVSGITVFLNKNEAEVELNPSPVSNEGINLEEMISPKSGFLAPNCVMQDSRRRFRAKMA